MATEATDTPAMPLHEKPRRPERPHKPAGRHPSPRLAARPASPAGIAAESTATRVAPGSASDAAPAGATGRRTGRQGRASARFDVPRATMEPLAVVGPPVAASPARAVERGGGCAAATKGRRPFDTLPGLEHHRISIIIPTLNEATNLPYVLAHIPHWVHEVVLVDGRSTDGTVEVATAVWPNNHIVREDQRHSDAGPPPGMPERRGGGITLRIVSEPRAGKGAALRSGFAAATGDILVMLDADGSTDPGEIPAFVGALLAGADFAKGSRFLPGGGTADMPALRRLGNFGFVTLVRLLFGGRFTDLCYGYNAFWARTASALQLDGDGFEIETMMNIRALQLGLRVVEIPSFEAARIHGVGRLRTFPDGWRVLKTIWRECRAPIDGARRGLLRRNGPFARRQRALPQGR